MKIIAITGQTATGKTNLALNLVQSENGELINYDSRQIYKYLDIITGKDIPKDKILLYDIVDPRDYFSSYDYRRYAIDAIKRIMKKGKTPILVGGTYFYLSHLLYGIGTENIKPDWPLRKKLSHKSVAQLQKLLQSLNKKLFNNLNDSERNNPQRLIRKIELLSSQSGGSAFLSQRSQPNYKKIILDEKLGVSNLTVKIIGLRFGDKTSLIKKIETRVIERIKQGAIDEVKQLLNKGYKQDDPGLRTIGYQQLIRFLQGKITKDEAIKDWINKEIQYAKRQYTFMKKDENIKWHEV